MQFTNISPDFYSNFRATDNLFIDKILKYEGTGQAVVEFNKIKEKLSDYSYWFLLSTLWVSYSGFSSLNLWKELFNSNRALKITSIMKPDELKAFKMLPYFVEVFRAHRPNEKDWMAYTLDFDIAKRLNSTRKGEIKRYKIKKKDITALFLRRSEKEIILTDKSKALLT